VISSGGANRRVLCCELGDYATLNFHHPSDATEWLIEALWQRDPVLFAGAYFAFRSSGIKIGQEPT
jgi:hypothetical protein